MSDRVFVDTNILVYLRDASEPDKQATAKDWFGKLWREETGRISVQVLNEFFVTVTRKLDPGLAPEKAWLDVQDLQLWNPEPVDNDLANRAYAFFSKYDLSWWDAMIVAAADRAQCSLILSEDMGHSQAFGDLRVLNPFLS